MFKIEVEIENLTEAQREAIAGFIMTYPHSSVELERKQSMPSGIPVPPANVLEMPSPAEAFATQTETAPAAGIPQYDASGLPWDERIHAGSRVMTADGLWRKRRGATDAEIATVEAELRKLTGTPAVPAPPPVATVPAPPPAETPVAAVPVPPPAVPVPAAPPATEGRQAFIDFVRETSGLIPAGKITKEELQAACIAHGVASVVDLQNNIDKIPAVKAEIDALLMGR